MRQLIYRAMHQSDDLVVTFDYCDAKGVTMRRVVSPIRFLGDDRFLALCLSREVPRQFYLDRCQNVRLAPAVEFLMPVALVGRARCGHAGIAGSPAAGRVAARHQSARNCCWDRSRRKSTEGSSERCGRG